MNIEWAAGLFEGEGSICVRMRRRGRQELQVSLSGTDEDVVRAFHRTVRLGSVHGPYKYKTNVKPYWLWSLHTWTEGMQFFTLVHPYLKSRRRGQIKVARLAWKERKKDARWL